MAQLVVKVDPGFFGYNDADKHNESYYEVVSVTYHGVDFQVVVVFKDYTNDAQDGEFHVITNASRFYGGLEHS